MIFQQAIVDRIIPQHLIGDCDDILTGTHFKDKLRFNREVHLDICLFRQLTIHLPDQDIQTLDRNIKR